MTNAALSETRDRFKWGRFGLIALAVVFILLIGLSLWLTVAGDPKNQFRISPETTVLTEPLTRDGLVDYVEALRQRNRDEVPNEENASRLLVEAIGPFAFGGPERFQQACVELGLEPLPATGDYFVSLRAVVETISAEESTVAVLQRFDDVDTEYDTCRKSPWSAADHPELARWLTANEVPLQKVHAASLMPHYREPVILSSPGKGSRNRLLTVTQELRVLSRLLLLRAMLRLNEDDAIAAWADIFAVHRLSRLAAQGNCVIEYLVACSIAGEAASSMQALLSSPHMTPELLETIESDWRGLTDWPDPASVVDTDQRHITLDVVQRIARFGPAELNELIERAVANGRFTGHSSYRANPFMTRVINAFVDWDQVMIETNDWYDRATAVIEETDPVRGAMLAEQFQRDAKQLELDIQDGWLPTTFRVGGIILVLTLPDVENLHKSIISRDVRSTIVETALAIEQFRFYHSRIPDSLNELVPEYLDAVPMEPCLPGDELRYITHPGDAYVLYSAGHDGVDNGGTSDYDDVIIEVRMPVPEMPQFGPQ